ncbi:MAG TPA: hypothetical protein VEF72_18865, partial [Mycobacterium sp.]|nr:hypothetical protein [Mycobacterium sp.]
MAALYLQPFLKLKLSGAEHATSQSTFTANLSFMVTVTSVRRTLMQASPQRGRCLALDRHRW